VYYSVPNLWTQFGPFGGGGWKYYHGQNFS